jgi:dextranase
VLLPTRARYTPGETVIVELPPAGHDRVLRVEHLGDAVATVGVPAGAGSVAVPPLPEGGYAVFLDGEHTAVEVLADPVARLRYGFIANFADTKNVDEVLRNFRRLHLTAAQFYDWAYRHADLVGPDPTWSDPLGQGVSLATVRALAAGLSGAGTLPIGYAAVYGVGRAEWQLWQHAALHRPDGQPYDLGGFLSIVDPADGRWLEHFTADLKRAARAGGFAGFHLDQYGYPRRAVRPDGRVVDVAAAFDTLIRAVRDILPDACLIFNNVNDFPVWVTTSSPQDVTYTEVWSPHDNLADVASVALRSRALAPDRPAVLAAYQSVFDKHPASVAETTTRLTMATLFSHGATQLLAGEAGHVLVDPYYVRNHPAEPGTLRMLADWYDLLVAAGDILFGPGVHDVTRSVAGSFNNETDVLGDVPLSFEATPGCVWRRITQTPQGTVMHLVNLIDQTETGWDTPKAPLTDVDGLRLRIRKIGPTAPRVCVADPDRGPGFTPLRLVDDSDDYLHADLPALHAWQIVLIRY